MADKVLFYITPEADYYEGEGGRGVDIETSFVGLRYLQCKGLEDKGRIKNKYQESFADSEVLKVYEPEQSYHEPTDITLTLLFVGEDRQSIYDSFFNYIRKGRFYYYDTKRRKEAYITLFDAVKPLEDTYKGGTPYIKVDFKFKNIKGCCEYKDI